MRVILWCFILACLTACQSGLRSGVEPVLLENGRLVANCGSQDGTHCMACALQGEAANQPPEGIYAVGVTIMTRARGKLEKICSVTKARRQFEGMKKSGTRRISKKVWRATQKIMKKKETRWTHFWSPREQKNLGRKKPFWAKAFETRMCDQKKIEGHIFYNSNKCRLKKRFKRLPASGS